MTSNVVAERDFTPHPVASGGITQTTAVEQSRAVAEVQAAVVVAQQCPRDLARVEGEMAEACGRTALAKRAFYRVPNRGSGPSVHLARELARIYGNFQYGVHELRRDDAAGISEIQAFAWDVQTNVRSTRTFQVPHQRMVQGKRAALVDLGDVYLNNQNIGARAVRECIFTALPTWFVEEAEARCRATLEHGDGKPLKERITDAVSGFADAFGIKQAQLEDKLGRKRGQWDAGDVASLAVLFQSLQRGEVAVEEEFSGVRLTAADLTGPPAESADPAPDAASGEADASGAEHTTTKARFTALQIKLRDLFGNDRAAVIEWVAGQVGREIESTKDLTATEVMDLLSILDGRIAPREVQP